MVAKKHRELEAWQLADRVRRDCHELTSRSGVRVDFEFCSETRRAARSACRNLAEGFYRFKHPEFAHFVNIAKGSLGELLDSLDEAKMKRYITDAEYAELHGRVDRALGVATGLYTYLIENPTPGSS